MSTYNYIIGDSRNIIKIFRRYKIRKPNLIITSPPYFNIKNYEGTKKQIGFGQDYDTYLKDIITIFQKCYEISSPNASLWMVTDTIRRDGITVPLPFDIHHGLINNYSLTWKLKDIIIWNKTKNIPWNAKGRFKNHFEYIFFYIKNERYKFNIDKTREIENLKKWWLTYPERYNPKGKAPSNIWEFITPIRGWGNGYLDHFCPFPFPLVERIISISTDENDLVFDPFTGSGSVLAMAYVMKRNSVGIDINKKYKKKFENEVLIGAKKYWDRKEKELKLIDKKAKKFISINKKLRKNKLGSIAIQWAKETYVNDDLIFLIVENKNRNEIECIIVGDNISIDISSINKNDKMKRFINTFKIKINWKKINQQKMLSSYSDINFYKYRFDKIYQYDSPMALEKVLTEINNRNCFFSNIKINISNINNFFKN